MLLTKEEQKIFKAIKLVDPTLLSRLRSWQFQQWERRSLKVAQRMKMSHSPQSPARRVPVSGVGALLLVCFLLLAPAKMWAAPYLTCDPYPASTTDANLNVVSFVITFTVPAGMNPVTVQAQVGTSGDRYLFYDVGPLANATYTVTAAALNGYALESPQSSPFTFSKGSPSMPTGLKLVPSIPSPLP